MSQNSELLIQNPVLTGFHPDPSICRVGDDFYIANSSFEYYPGVPIHHSKNLQDWKLIGYALTRESQLMMRGNPKSGGIWAPALSHDGEKFHLIFTDVKDWAGAATSAGGTEGFKDVHNYLVTAENINGPWSDPVFLNSSGFDPSMFHDDDGRKYLVNVLWDYRPGKHSFAGIVLQEYSPWEKKMVGPIRNIFRGSSLKLTEAPHLYKRGEFYYLVTAEGGTSYSHAVTVARSKKLEGPYDLHPRQHLLTSVADIDEFRKRESLGSFADLKPALHSGLQKAGHGSIVPWTDDVWVLAHLCGRPVDDSGQCPLGRETAIQRVIWKNDQWPYVEETGAPVTTAFPARDGVKPATVKRDEHWREDFEESAWDLKLNTLRKPAGEDFDLSSRPGWLRLQGRESMMSRFDQSILVRRVQHFHWSAETCVEFQPSSFQQMAGLIVRYDETCQSILRISDQDGARRLGIINFDLNRIDLPLGDQEKDLKPGPVWLGVDTRGRSMRFRYRQDGEAWKHIGPEIDAGILSDDYVHPMGFTGTYVGIGSFDVSGQRLSADFDYLEYSGSERPHGERL
ncbi:glycoside hydrolase family 43 protein [Salinispira pacifica]|uniref:Beta-xylosidase n=1 Tax=Salinispira pacifica TaxID=1307761 RepID=V5WJP1_9SPIO|nr:glycoside hydrolase family 43 protein [Salinispira pacifica]AHC15870.1 Beta-xylosidase [Salinispira pacifica]